ncbi:hypothetical protein EJB05_51404, partial [Eragrostis curvula]
MAAISAILVKKVVVVAICITLVLLSVGPAAMADVLEDCRNDCRSPCNGFSTAVCKGLTRRLRELLFATCKVRISALCSNTCINLCSIDTLPGAGRHPIHYGNVIHALDSNQ